MKIKFIDDHNDKIIKHIEVNPKIILPNTNEYIVVKGDIYKIRSILHDYDNDETIFYCDSHFMRERKFR